jgi:phage-related protein
VPEIFVGSVAVGVVPDARGWNRKLRAELVPSASQIGDEVGENISRRIVDNMGKSGTESAGAFSDNFSKRLRAALAKLPTIKIDAESSKADVKIAELARRMKELSDKKIGVDISSKDAIKELGKIDAELAVVQKHAENINVHFDTTAARAQLALLKHEANTAGDESGRGLMQKLAGGITGAATSIGGGGGATLPGLGAVSPAALAIGGALGLFALPFIGQVAGGAVVSAFGLALAAMPIIGAARNAEVKKTFDDLKTSVLQDFEIIGQSWVPVLESILNTAKQTMNHLTPVFEHAAQTIAGPFKLFVDTLIRAFEQPQVAASIDAVAKAFAAILTAVTPDLPGMIATLADAVLRIANVIKDNPKAFANFINFLVQVTAAVLNAIAFLTELATFMEGRFKQNINEMVSAWGTSTNALHTAWSNTMEFFHSSWSKFINFFTLAGHQMEMDWNAACGNVHASWSNTVNFIHNIWSNFINFWVVTGHQLEAAWNSVCDHVHSAWSTTVNFLHQKWSEFINFWVTAGHQIEATWNTVCGTIHNAWSTAVNFLHQKWSEFINFFVTIGHQIESSWNGVVGYIKSLWSGAVAFVSNAVNGMYDVIHAAFGRILQAASWAFGWIPGIGPKLREANAQFNGFRDQANASLAGIQDRHVNVTVDMMQKTGGHAFGPQAVSVIGKATGGLISWGTGPTADDVPILASRGEFVQPDNAVRHYGLPFMESIRSMRFAAGGLIPNINTSGLASFGKNMWSQISGTVSSAFSGAGGFLKQVIHIILQALPSLLYQAGAAISGISGYSSGGQVMDSGGWIPPGASTVYNFTGRAEHLVPDGAGSGGGATYHAHFDGLTGAAIESHVQTAFTAMSLREGALHRQGRRQ